MDAFDFIGNDDELGNDWDWNSIGAGLGLDLFNILSGQASAPALQQQQPQSTSVPTVLSMQQQSPQSFAPAQANNAAPSLTTPPHHHAPTHFYAVGQEIQTMRRTPMNSMLQQQQLFTPPPTRPVSLSLNETVSGAAHFPNNGPMFGLMQQHTFPPAMTSSAPYTNAQTASIELQQSSISPLCIPATPSIPPKDLCRPMLHSTNISTASPQSQQNSSTQQPAHVTRRAPSSLVSSPAMPGSGYASPWMSITGYAQQTPSVGHSQTTFAQRVMAANIGSPANMRSTPAYMSEQIQRSYHTSQPPAADMTAYQQEMNMTKMLQIQEQARLMQRRQLLLNHRKSDRSQWQQSAAQIRYIPVNQQHSNAHAQFDRPQQVMAPMPHTLSPHIPHRHNANMNAFIRLGMKSNGALGPPIDLTSPTFPPTRQGFGPHHTPTTNTSQPMSRNSSGDISRDSGISMTPPTGFLLSSPALHHANSASALSISGQLSGKIQAPPSREPAPIPSTSKKRSLQEMAGPADTMYGTSIAPPPKKRGRPPGSKTNVSLQQKKKGSAANQDDIILVGSLLCNKAQALMSTKKMDNVNTPEFADLLETLAQDPDKTLAKEQKQEAAHLMEFLFSDQLKQATVGPPVTQAAQQHGDQSKLDVVKSPGNTRLPGIHNAAMGSTAHKPPTFRASPHATSRVSREIGASQPPLNISPTPEPIMPVKVSEEGLANILTAEIRRMSQLTKANNPPAPTLPTLLLVQGPVTANENAKALLEEQKAIAREYEGHFTTNPDYQTPAPDQFLNSIRAAWTHELRGKLISQMDLPETWVEVGLGGYVPPLGR